MTSGGADQTQATVHFFAQPAITGLSPGSGGVHSTVTLTGTNFAGATHVRLNGTDAAFAVVSDTEITFTVPAGATSGTISVVNPVTSGVSTGTFTVVPLSTISGFSPGSGSVGTPVAISGTGLTGTIGVEIGSIVTVPVSVSDTQVVFTIPPGADSGRLRILNPAGDVTSAGTFVVTASSPGSIASFDPTSGVAGTSATIDGSGFTGATAVMFGGTAAASFTVVSDSRITATVPAGAHSGSIVVVTPGGTITSADAFTAVLPPTISSLDPDHGGQRATVTVTGSDFTGVTGVTLAGTACAFSVVSDTKLTFTVPAGAASGHVAITTAGGTTTSTATFTVDATPTITAIGPTSGAIGDTITITGSNLAGDTRDPDREHRHRPHRGHLDERDLHHSTRSPDRPRHRPRLERNGNEHRQPQHHRLDVRPGRNRTSAHGLGRRVQRARSGCKQRSFEDGRSRVRQSARQSRTRRRRSRASAPSRLRPVARREVLPVERVRERVLLGVDPVGECPRAHALLDALADDVVLMRHQLG